MYYGKIDLPIWNFLPNWLKSKSFNRIGYPSIIIPYQISKFYIDGYNQEENFRGISMSKILKAMALLLILTAVVFAAGCANKTSNTSNSSAAVTPAETPVSTVTPAETPVSTVTPAETPVSTVTPTETPASVVTSTETNNSTANTTENITPSVTVTTPENTTVQTGTHLSTAERNRELIKSRMNSSTGTNISQ
jgi:hypothetical protein